MVTVELTDNETLFLRRALSLLIETCEFEVTRGLGVVPVSRFSLVWAKDELIRIREKFTPTPAAAQPIIPAKPPPQEETAFKLRT